MKGETASNEACLSELRESLHSLRRENRRWRWAAAGLASIFSVAMVIAAADKPSPVKGPELILTGTDGKPQSIIGSYSTDGKNGIGFADAKGNIRASLLWADEGRVCTWTLYDAQGNIIQAYPIN